MVSSERLVRAVVVAAVPAAVGVALSPPHPTARIVVGVGTLLGCLPAAYLLARIGR